MFSHKVNALFVKRQRVKNLMRLANSSWWRGYLVGILVELEYNTAASRQVNNLDGRFSRLAERIWGVIVERFRSRKIPAE